MTYLRGNIRRTFKEKKVIMDTPENKYKTPCWDHEETGEDFGFDIFKTEEGYGAK